MARLTVVDGPDTGHEFDVELEAGSEQEQVTIGRDPRVEVPLNDQAISREHCRIEVTLRGFRVVDLGSRNKTYVNGDPIENFLLRHGDVVRVGDTDLRFEDEAGKASSGAVASTIIKELPADRAVKHSIVEEIRTITESTDPARTHRILERVRKLLDVSNGLGSTRSENELIEKFLATITTATGATSSGFLVPEGTSWLVKRVHQSDEKDADFQVSLSIVDRAAKEKTAILCEHSASDGRFRAAESMIREDIRSAIAVPVLDKSGELLGAIYIDRRGDDAPFEESDLELLLATTAPLTTLLESTQDRERLEDENRLLIRTLTNDHKIIGATEGVRDLLEFIERSAPTPMTVLIQGETGTGKELVALAVHYSSPRKSRPFVALNCAAMPENLVESELFGHERGAFTGAVSRKKGRFELAHTGTVFLDEIGELSLPCQAKLLRLLEERRFERVGGTEPIEVDVRVIAATNRDLVEAVEQGEFRADLLYRLDVLSVTIPPLRERREDISLLVDHFLAKAAAAGRPKKLSRAAEKVVLRYDWPGNVRQLRNAIESATVLGRGDEIRPEDLSLPDITRRGSSAWEPISLQELEKIHVLKTLEYTGGNKKRAAEILGIERCTLYSKLKNYEA